MYYNMSRESRSRCSRGSTATRSSPERRSGALSGLFGGQKRLQLLEQKIKMLRYAVEKEEKEGKSDLPSITVKPLSFDSLSANIAVHIEDIALNIASINYHIIPYILY